MTTYEIFSDSEYLSKFMENTERGIALKDCREKCNQDGKCVAFTWEEEGSICGIKTKPGDAWAKTGSSLYVKKSGRYTKLLILMLMTALIFLAVAYYTRSDLNKFSIEKGVKNVANS